MDTFDFLGEQVVITPAGRVALSLASHDDGAVSVVAWLMPSGRRVGYLYGRPRQRAPREEMVDPLLDGTSVRRLMVGMLEHAIDHSPRQEPIGRRLVRAGLLTEGDLSDLLGWQWLLAELGQPRRLGELAAEAGMVATPGAHELVGEPIERRAPARPVDPALPLADDAAVAAI
jgi:hypothetical protein